MAKSQTTTMFLTKECKKVARFDNPSEDNPVVDNFYLKNEAYDALGKPKEITITVSTK